MMKHILLTLITVVTIALGMATAHATGLAGEDPNARMQNDGAGTSAIGSSPDASCPFCQTPSNLTLSSGDRKAAPGTTQKTQTTESGRGGTGN